MSSPTRRPSGITRPHPARAAADAARAADGQEEPTPSGTGERVNRMVSGRVSYAGKAATVYFPTAEDRQRAKAAFLARGGTEGYMSETEWWADVILAAVEDWETTYNGGQPFTVRSRTPRRHRGAGR